MGLLPQPDVILTHESDLDGLLAGLLCQRLARRLFGGGEVALQAYHNHSWRQRPMTERAAWVCDLAFDPRLDKPNWLVIDHHPAEGSPRQARLIHDPNQSAAALSYGLCREHGLATPELDRLVHLSDIADLFLVEDPDFALGCDYASLVKTYGFWNLGTLIEFEPERLLDHPLLEVMRAKREVENPIGLAWSRQRIAAISPKIGFVQTLIGNTNLIIHDLLHEKEMRYEVLMTLYRRANGIHMLSLRSRNGEAGPLAEKLHGGGHPNAAGAMLPRSVQSVADAINYLRQVLNPQSIPCRPASGVESLFDSGPPD